MDDAKFDRLARASGKTVSRRWLLALLVTVLNMLSQRVSRGSQLGPGTCNEQGAVCTLLSGCCDGLTCATSSINTSYGICVPGEGGMVSTGPTLISPFSDTAVQELAPLVQTAAAAPTADPRPDRKERLAEIKARKDAKRTEEKTRLRAKRDAKKIREQERHNRRLEARGPKKGMIGPQLQLKLIRTNEDDIKTTEVKEVPVDTVKVTNLDDVNIAITRIEARLAPEDGSSLTTPPARFTLSPRETYAFVAGLTVTDSTDERFDWTSVAACNGSPGAGFLVKAAFSLNSENYDYTILCDGPNTIDFVEKPRKRATRKRKHHDHHRNRKKR